MFYSFEPQLDNVKGKEPSINTIIRHYYRSHGCENWLELADEYVTKHLQFGVIDIINNVSTSSDEAATKVLQDILDTKTDMIRDLRNALIPFSEVFKHDIGEDEEDHDIFTGQSRKHHHAPLLNVGDFRYANEVFIDTGETT